MKHLFEERDFVNLFDDDSGARFERMEFRRCRFVNCVLSNTRNPPLRTTVREVCLIDCTVDGGSLGPAVVEDVTVHNLKLARDLFARGTAFRHVTLSGRTGAIVIAPLYPIADGTDAEVRPINEANKLYYRGVDWALDIENLNCLDCEIRNVPASLIRRDPKTQAVVRRVNVKDERRWRDLENTCWAYHIGTMIDDGADDCVLVAGKRSSEFKELLDGIEFLRAEGVADPD